MRTDPVKKVCDDLMAAVVKLGVCRTVTGNGVAAEVADHDAAVAVRVMREELKAFLSKDNGKYADERELALTGRHNLAMASVVAECGRRILAERN